MRHAFLRSADDSAASELDSFSVKRIKAWKIVKKTVLTVDLKKEGDSEACTVSLDMSKAKEAEEAAQTLNQSVMAAVAWKAMQKDAGDSTDDSIEPTVAPPERYKALGPGIVRKAADKASEKVGKLEEGEVIEALSTAEVDGTTRVEFDRGWVSVTAGSGKALLELLE